MALSTEILESQYKTFLKTFQIFNYNRFLNFTDFLTDFLTISLRERESVFTFYLRFIICSNFVFNFFFSWVLFLNDCLQKRSLQIIAKLDEHF